MSFYYLLGEKFNVLKDAITITPSSEDSLFPVERIHNDAQGEVFRFATAGADDKLTADLSNLSNPGFEDWTLPTVPDGWTDESLGTGNLSEETTLFHGGASALKLDSGGANNEAIATREVTVRSGAPMTFSGWIRGDGTFPTIIRIRCLETGSYLTSGGTWQAASADFGSITSATYAEETASFTVETFSVTLRDTVTLEIMVRYDENANAGYADDFALWHHWDFLSIHGHNLGAMITPEARSSTDDFSGDDTLRSSTLALARPSFYEAIGSTVTDRYFRLLLDGTNFEPGELGALIVGMKQTLPRAQNLPYNITPRIAKAMQVSRGGHISKIALARDESQTIPLNWRLTTAQYESFRDEIERRSTLGTARALIVPDSDRAEVYFGNFSDSFPAQREKGGSSYITQATFIEDGFALRVR